MLTGRTERGVLIPLAPPPLIVKSRQSLLGGSGRHADGERPARRVGHLTLLGQEGACRGREGGAAAAAEARLHRQLLEVDTLATKNGSGRSVSPLRREFEKQQKSQ